jgi:hypothetical protein
MNMGEHIIQLTEEKKRLEKANEYLDTMLNRLLSIINGECYDCGKKSPEGVDGPVMVMCWDGGQEGVGIPGEYYNMCLKCYKESQSNDSR